MKLQTISLEKLATRQTLNTLKPGSQIKGKIKVEASN